MLQRAADHMKKQLRINVMIRRRAAACGGNSEMARRRGVPRSLRRAIFFIAGA